MGQELTARMHYRGLIKKRLFPIKSVSGVLTTGEDLQRGGRFAGKIGSTVDNWGLVCLKTADIETPHETASGISVSITNPQDV
jgi:folate-binding Fe-S cluster repair protein YgfZ